MPYVTVEQVAETMNGEVGRSRVAVDALLKALSQNLSGLLLELGLPEPHGYHYAHEEVPKLPAVVVSHSIMAEPHGGGYTDNVSAHVRWEAPHPLSRADWQVALDVATAVRGLLYMPAFRGTLTVGNMVVWDYTIPVGIVPEAADPTMTWGGMGCELRLVQHGRKGTLNPLWPETSWAPNDLELELAPADVIAYMNAACGRPRLAMDGVLDVLHDSLPQVLADQGLPQIWGYHWAGEEIPRFPAIVVACSTSAQDFGTHFADQIHLTVNVVCDAPLGRKEKAQALEIATLARAVLCTGHLQGPFQSGEGEPILWHWLSPTGIEPLPMNMDANYGGYTAHFEVLQNPPGSDAVNLW